MTQKTREEIDALKANWLNDPCWNIEKTEGFEEHEAELLEFRKEHEAKWEQEKLDRQNKRAEKVLAWTGIDDFDLAQHLSTPDEIESQISFGERQENPREINSANARATLLLAMQVKRLADLLGSISTNEGLMVTAITEDRFQL